MKFVVDQDACIGCGACAAICPKVFAINDQGLAQAVAQPAPDDQPAAVEVMESCPVAAISEA